MIITIRGPSGAGKSTLVRRLVEPLPPPLYVHAHERKKRPQYGIYLLGGPHKLIVLGHYLVGNGGIDTLSSLNEAYGLADRHAREGSHVLMEGKCMSDGVPQVQYLRYKHYDVRALVLTTDVETCIASVRERGHNIKRESIEKVHAKVQRAADTFESLGITTYRGDRDECLRQARTWLGMKHG